MFKSNLKTLLPPSPFFESNSCEYTIGAAPANDCLSKTLASQAKIIIGNGPLAPASSCPQPVKA